MKNRDISSQSEDIQLLKKEKPETIVESPLDHERSRDKQEKTHIQIIALIPENFPPYYFLDNKKRPTGFAIDVLNRVAELSGIEVKYVIKDSWSSVDKAFRDGEGDLIPNLGITENRKNQYDFTMPVEIFPLSIFIRKNGKAIRNETALQSLRVGVVRFNVGEKWAYEHNIKDLNVYSTPEEAILSLLSGEIDCVIYPEPVFLKVSDQLGVKGLIRETGKPLLIIKRAIAVRKGEGNLLEILNLNVERFIKTSEYKEIREKWFGVRRHFWTTKRVVSILGILIIISAMIITLWKLSITRRMNQRLSSLIDELSSTQKKLAEKHKLLKEIINTVPDFIYVKDRDMRFILANRATAEVMGASSPGELIGKTDFEYYPEHIARDLYQREKKVIEERKSIIQDEEFILDHKGDEKWVSTTKVPLYDSANNVTGLIGIGRDITEKKKIENELKKEKERLTQYLNIAPVIILVLDREANVKLINKKGCEVIGDEEVEIIGKNWIDNFIPEKLRNGMREVFNTVVSGETEKFNYHENPIITSNGEIRMVAWHNTLVKDDNGSIIGVLSAGEDITELTEAQNGYKEKEKQLQQAQRMEAIGRLTAGIAHDFNNLLSVIIGYSDLLAMKVGNLREQFTEINEIKTAGQKASDLINQLLAYSRKESAIPEPIDLNVAVRGLEKIIKRTVGENIEVIIKLDNSLGMVMLDVSLIEQVLMNLIVNARDAMPDGGKLIIATKNVHLGERYTHTHYDIPAGDYVMLSVSDNGMGIDEEIREHIFEPFFSTKKEIGGTGLGLYTVYSVVKKNNGYIYVYSEPGMGTVFKIYFPVIKKEKSIKAEDKHNHQLQRGDERILLVEDEDQVREMIKESLRSLGYKVIGFENPIKALKSLETIEPETISLIITDMVMPGLNGKEFIARIIKKLKDIKILCISGYSEELINDHAGNIRNIYFLHKPFSVNKLSSVLRDILD